MTFNVESKTTPLLSVRLMTYNHEPYIKEAIDSCLMQKTNFQIEIVIGDDFSTDRTREICEDYALKYPDKINLLNRPMHGDYWQERQKSGRLYNFFDILKNCRGKYIALLDGDDYWTDSYKLQKQVDFLEANPDYVITYHDYYSIKDLDDNRTKSPLTDTDKMDSTEEDLILYRKWIKSLSICFRNIVLDFPEEMKYIKNGDAFFLSMIGNHGKGKWMGNEIEPAIYREHAGGIWSATLPKQRNMDILNTNYWICLYYERMGNKEISGLWFEKLMKHIGYIEKTTFNKDSSIYDLYTRQKRELSALKNSRFYKMARIVTGPSRFLKILVK